jgi:beta-mannosidase
MRKILIGFLTLSGILTIGCQKQKQETRSLQQIHENWQFKCESDTAWLSASIPGCIHTDLLHNKIIEDPYYRLNEKSQQWIGETDWIYKTEFKLSDDVSKKDHISLIFKGLDTYADVYLNDSLILTADNMFRSWEIPVKHLLQEELNTLKIYFHNVFKINMPKYENAPYELQAWSNNDQADIKINMYSRKAGFHYGWDWGPRLITAGIWRPVYLEGWDHFKIENVHYIQEEVSIDQARIIANLFIQSDEAVQTKIEIKHEQKVLASKYFDLSAGQNIVSLEFTIDNPRLWWTNGLGEQPLYEMIATISDDQGIYNTLSEKIGIRSIEIVREDDKFGKSMYVKLNGHPVFMKGANYIPQDNFQNRVTRENYEYIIKSAADANMNMLRVWGGGIYENDLFYDLCDKYGILVWQDIMFACAMYPSDKEFLYNVSKEVTENVTRLRNHPSIALFCGNNENEISWYRGGWKDKYNEATQKQYEQDLHTLFYVVIPEAVKKAAPNIYFHQTSPNTGYNGIDKNMGDSHYWGVWHGKEPFVSFSKYISRFVSEYGFQSYPEFSSIEKFTIPEDWFLESEVMHAHQRCMGDNRRDKDYGNRLINTYLERNFNTPKDFENYIYVVQANQAKGIRMAIEAHRQKKADNYCMGTLYWQLNDCWPVASWSSIDYYGKWKALHYFAKKSFEPVILTAEEVNNKLNVYIVSDELDSIANSLFELKLMDFSGNILWETAKTINIPANTSRVIFSEKVNTILSNYDRNKIFLSAEIKVNGKPKANKLHFFDIEKNLRLEKPYISKKVQKTKDGYSIELQTNNLARYVMLSIENEDVSFSDNYFDMIPGEKIYINMQCKNEIAEIENKLKIISLVDSY